jgi:hypothetical protein
VLSVCLSALALNFDHAVSARSSSQCPSLPQAPPTVLSELEAYIRETVRKELSRDSITFGSELGSGEFGAVYRGEHTAADVESGTLAKQTVAIKMLKNCKNCVCVCVCVCVIAECIFARAIGTDNCASHQGRRQGALPEGGGDHGAV